MSVFSLAYCQTTQIDYDFKVNIYQQFIFPAKLLFDTKGNKKYTVLYGISGQLKKGYMDNTSIVEKGYAEYILYASKSSDYFIKAEIKNKDVFFKDKKNLLKYTLVDKQKQQGAILLSMATTEFRGRKYTLWYDPKSKIKFGPWKFTNLPGLAYEIYDETGQYKWELKTISKTKENLTKNPLLGNSFVEYKEYPKLKFGDMEKNKKELEKLNIYQERTGLETKFEWEN